MSFMIRLFCSGRRFTMLYGLLHEDQGKLVTFGLQTLNHRCITTSVVSLGKRNFRKFRLPNKRGFRAYKDQQQLLGMVDHRGVRLTGYLVDRNGPYNEFQLVPEMIPELIVPNLKDFKLKSYVSYRAADVVQSEFTAKDLFNATYAKKIVTDFKSGQLDTEGNPLNPSDQEKLTKDEAMLKSRSTGSDIFG